MTTFGRQVLSNTGNGLQVTSDGQPEWLTGGSTVDWGTINPVTVDTVLPIEGITVPAGSSYLRYGQVMCRIRGTQQFVGVLSGGSGNWNISVTIGGNTQTTTALAYGASAAAVQAALVALSNVGAGNATVTLAGSTYTINFTSNLGTVSITSNPISGSAALVAYTTSGSTFTVTEASGAGGGDTITYNVTAGGVTLSTPAQAYNASAATVQAAIRALGNVGGTNATVTLAGGVYTITFVPALGTVLLTTTNAGAEASTVLETVVGNNGKWGPYDPSARDGRQLLTRGDCGILNATVLQKGPITAFGTAEATDHLGLITGGILWKARILMAPVTASLAAGPTVAAFETAFTRVRYANQY